MRVTLIVIVYKGHGKNPRACQCSKSVKIHDTLVDLHLPHHNSSFFIPKFLKIQAYLGVEGEGAIICYYSYTLKDTESTLGVSCA